MPLFKPATAAGRKAKVLLYGGTGTGKTVAALSFPRCAVIDAERGTDFYADNPSIKPFEVTHTQDLDQMLEAINEVRADNGRNFDTLVIDPMTVFYDRLKGFHVEKNALGKGLRYDQRSEVNERMKPIYQALTGLPVHLVVVAREAINYKANGNSLIDAGVKPDIDSRASYLFDFIIRLDQTHQGTFEKSRGTTKVQRLLRVTWSALQPLVEATDEKPAPPAASDEQVAAIRAWYSGVRSLGLSDADWLTALGGITGFAAYGDWTDPATAEKATKAGQNFKASKFLSMGKSSPAQDTTN